MKTLLLAVREGTRPEVVVEIQAERTLVGSGAHCDIRLPPEAAAFEHAVITEEEDEIVVRAVRSENVFLVDGVAKREAELVGGSTLTIAQVAIRVVRIESSDVKPKKKGRLKKVALAVVVGPLIAAGLLVLRNATAEVPETVPSPPDPLRPAVTSCPEARGALALASQKLELAFSKEQRFRFYPRDGVDAVTSYEQAGACFRAGHDAAGAEDAEGRARFMRRQVVEAFHASRVRLDRALVRKDPVTALEQVKFQRDLLFGNERAETYVAWLALLQSKLESVLSKQ